MYIFLDDVRMPDRADAIVIRTAEEAIDLIFTGVVSEISFDHDLGSELTGYNVACVIEALIANGSIDMPIWRVHSANPVGRERIEAAMRSAERFSACKEPG